MKRCPQCEFTFHDDRQLCDFDGAELSAVIERSLSSQNFSAPRAMLPSFVLRLLRSNLSLAVLALAGIVLSAVLVAYYSASEVESKGETGDSAAGLASPAQDSEASLVPETRDSVASPVASDQTPAKNRTPDTVTRRRATRARASSSLTSSTVARRSAVFRSRTRFRLSTHKLEAMRRRYAEPEWVVRPAVDGADKQLLARNQRRPGSPEHDAYQRNTAGVGNTTRVANGQPGWFARKSVAGRESENAPKEKESRVIVMLKKTGRMLTRPFKFLTRV